MGQALYRKYRSKKFDEVVGQKHITSTLRKAIKNGRLSHAYLFTGPRGVGKTTVARILAHEVNGLPYDDETSHLDIIEIDAASNRRIDEIRDLRDRARITPTSAAYKVYIIDEVHMLTREAFNALLKTLEEPPAHCIFILATTEAHKLPETIISRTQRFEFRPIDAASAATQLQKIAEAESIEIDDEALELLARHGEGSFRDSISLLDQLSAHGGRITGLSVREFLGLPSASSIDTLITGLDSANQADLLTALDELNQQGIAPSFIAAALARKLRQRLIDKSGEDWVAGLLRALFEIPASPDPGTALEISLLEATTGRVMAGPGTTYTTIAQKPRENPEPVIKKSGPNTGQKPAATTKGFNDENWRRVVEDVKAQAASLYTALRLAAPRVEGQELILSFEFPLHKKKLELAKHKELVAKIVSDVTGKNYAIKPVVEKKQPGGTKTADPELQTISNIFGQTEMLES